MPTIRAKPTPYHQYLLQEGYVAISSDWGDGHKREYLIYGKRCLFCSGDRGEVRSGRLLPFKTMEGRNTAELICNQCNKTQGMWHDMSPSGKNRRWEYTPSTDTDIYRERFDIHSKIKKVLLGLPI